jgi:hypothetical protein
VRRRTTLGSGQVGSPPCRRFPTTVLACGAPDLERKRGRVYCPFLFSLEISILPICRAKFYNYRM